ncbi:MAG: hypothetical protein Kow009_01270 [Spirochaetales bacterium]
MNRMVRSFLGVALGLLLGVGNTSSLLAQPYSGILLRAVQNAILKLPPNHAALQAGEYPLALFHDLDGDGLEDIFLLSTEKGKDDEPGGRVTDTRILSEYSRLFDARSAQPFALHIFLRRQSSVSLLRTIELGSKRVFGSFRLFEIRHAARIPFGIEITFPNQVGLERRWILVSSSSRIELFGFQEQHNVKSFVKDIDEDGLLDLVLFEDLFEDSVGYETYTSWYRWEKTTYKRYRSVNILRNLRNFLRTVRAQILRKDWKAFFRYALQPKDVAYALAAGVEEVLPRIFRVSPPPLYPVAGEEVPHIGIEVIQKDFKDLIYPEILENPFNLREDGPESFLLTFRLVVEGDAVFLSVRVAMYKNFFGERMFHLVLQ